MRSIVDYPEVVKQMFSYLIDEYGFRLIEEDERSVTFINVYQKGSIKIELNFDMRDNFFNFSIIKNDTPRSDEPQRFYKNFYDLLADKEWKKLILQPDDDQYKIALANNATVLKKYGDLILRDEKWPWES